MTTGRVDESQTTPSVWVDLLDEHDHELRRVRLMWRRGGGRYRPLVRPGIDPADLEHAPLADWETHELPAACPHWVVEPNETPDERRRRLKLLADHFWRLGVQWTRDHGPICDLQLRGYTDGDAILFEAGKRCNLASEQPAEPPTPFATSSEGLSPREREREREFTAAREARLLADVGQIHRTYGDLLGSLKQERDDAIRTLQESTRTIPSLFGAATDAIKDSIGFQKEHVRDLIANASGTREFEVRAFAERQQSYRHERTLGFLRDAVTASAGSVGSLIAQVIQTVNSKTSHGILEYQVAQQAIAFLHLTLMPGQLAQLFPHREASAEFMGLLLAAAAKDDESEALHALKGMEGMFRSPGWAQVAMPDQQIAARFIVGRAAMLRVRYAAGASV